MYHLKRRKFSLLTSLWVPSFFRMFACVGWVHGSPCTANKHGVCENWKTKHTLDTSPPLQGLYKSLLCWLFYSRKRYRFIRVKYREPFVDFLCWKLSALHTFSRIQVGSRHSRQSLLFFENWSIKNFPISNRNQVEDLAGRRLSGSRMTFLSTPPASPEASEAIFGWPSK